MTAFDRDAALEREQIQGISDNVARRLLRVMERSRMAHPMIAAEVHASAEIIADIRRETERIMAATPFYEPLDVALLTHVLSSHQQALSILELLEAKTAGLGQAQHLQPDTGRAHAALLATSREIEQDAQRYAEQGFAALRPPAGYLPAPAPAPAPMGLPDRRAAPPRQLPPPAHRPPAGAVPPQQRPQPKKKPKAEIQTVSYAARLKSAREYLVNPKNAGKTAMMAVGFALALGVLSFMPARDDHARHAALAPGQKLDGRLDAGQQVETSSLSSSLPGTSAEAAPAGPIIVSAASAATMEQPYLVVLTTRKSTEELQQDFRSYKASYPDLLGTAKARVDRVQGQDRQTWYRLSLIPPRARDDAKSLCSNLKAGGLTGCWIKPVPLN